MIKNTQHNLTQNSGASGLNFPPGPHGLRDILDRVSSVVQGAEKLSRNGLSAPAGIKQELQKTAEHLLQTVRQHMSKYGGPSPGLSDALRPLVVSGARPKGVTATVFALLPEAALAHVTQCITDGDRKAFEQLTHAAAALPSGDHSHLRKQLGELALRAVSTRFADEVIAVYESLGDNAAHSNYERKASLTGAPPSARSMGLAPPKSHGSLKTALDTPPPALPRLLAWKAKTAPAHIPMQDLSVSVRAVHTPNTASAADPMFVSSIPVVEGIKTPLTPKTYDEAGHLIKPRFSMVATTGENSMSPLLVTHTLFQGSYGKVSLGVNADGYEFALKSFRTYDPELPAYAHMSTSQIRASARKATHLTENNAVIAEAEETQWFRRGIEDHCAQYDDPNRPVDDALRAARTQVSNFDIYGIVVLPEHNNVKKMLMVMDREDGDMFTLMQFIDARCITALALSTAAQLYTECEAMHDAAQMGHFDIKLENMLFSKTGQVKHTDFGFANTISDGGRRLAPSAMFGSLLTPEHVAIVDADEPEIRAYTAGTDVFALALTVASIMALQSPPFMLSDYVGPQQFMQDEATQFLAGFTAYRQNLFVDGRLDPTRANTHDVFGVFFGPGAQAHPALFALLMEHALNPDPSSRWPASRIAREARALLVAPGAPDFKLLRKNMAHVAKQDQGIGLLRAEAAKVFARSQPS